ncbi:HNH endonuclease [Psychromonas sp. Urea-02u-13]|uniref:HNH endonuclease n=1 Tax=Psychromonas sp. Urea-02u-13 TaxID=2058326 RepID=UPI000C31F47F|nr:HNH endonuclease [Psychromonas sp. Urea-02u-13]PKG38932.1 HNH endonuclease [Psychromonas sp. Urea-02u-13]
MLQWQRTNNKNNQKPLYTFEEIDGKTLRVTRNNDGEIFKRDFSIGHRFTTDNGLSVEMTSLDPNGGSPEFGYYLIAKEITNDGYGRKADVSAQNQIDKLYFNQDENETYTASSEIKSNDIFIEGTSKQVLVNRYERDPKARKACIDHFGLTCQICSFDFSKFYGAYGEGFIEVHHIKPLSEINNSYSVNPLIDLIPVCSNCHSILHRGKQPLSIDEMKSMFK